MIAMRPALLAATFFCAAGFAQTAVAQTGEIPQRGGTAITVLTADPVGLNPAITTNVPDRQLGCTLYHGLVDVASNLTDIVPQLAKAWTISPDGKTYSFELADAYWHDGKPFTSEDVKVSMVEVNAKYSALFAPASQSIDSIGTPAPNKVIFRLNQPFGPFLVSLSCQQGGAILPAHLFKGVDAKNNPATMSPVGTGAFKFAEWKHGDFVRLSRNDKYHQPGKPYLDGVIAKIIPLPSSRIQALTAGEVDHVAYYPAEQIAAAKKNPKLKTVSSDMPPSYTVLFFNVDKKPFNDKRVRQALFMASNRDYIFKNAMFEHGRVGTQPFPTLIPWLTDPELDYNKMYPYDPAKANALLDEAGVKRGADGKRLSAKLTLYSNLYPELTPASVALKAMWAQVGIDLSIETLEYATAIKRVYQDRDFDMMMNIQSSYADPALGLARGYVSASIGKPSGNPSGWSTKEIDELFRQGSLATTVEDRAKIYRQIQKTLADELSMLNFRDHKEVDAASVRLKGLWGRIENNGSWADAWLQQ